MFGLMGATSAGNLVLYEERILSSESVFILL